MYQLVYIEDLTTQGFYKEGIHSHIPTPNINITNGLWQELLSLGEFKLVSQPEDKVYTKDDINFFEKVIPPIVEVPQTPNMDDRLLFLEEEHLLNVSSILELDYRVMELEIMSPVTLDVKMALFNARARTPYQMMKTLILANEYNELDMKTKINRYHELNKITDIEKEELLGLIEANKIVA